MVDGALHLEGAFAVMKQRINVTRGHGQFKATRPERKEKRKEWLYCLKLSVVNSL